MTPQQAEFAKRLARIEAGAARPRATIFVGPDEAYEIDRTRHRRRRSPLATLIGNALYPLSFLLAFVLGGLGYGLARYIRFHLTGVNDTPLDPDIEMLVDLAMGLVCTVLVSQVDRMRAPEQKVAKALGVIICLLTFHNLVHEFPEFFTGLFSKLWVTTIIASTEPHSLLWRGISFTF